MEVIDHHMHYPPLGFPIGYRHPLATSRVENIPIHRDVEAAPLVFLNIVPFQSPSAAKFREIYSQDLANLGLSRTREYAGDNAYR